MSITKATSKVIIDPRREKLDGTYPLKLRVIFRRESRDYGIGIDLTKEEYQQLNNPRNRIERLRDFKIRIGVQEARANEIIKALPEFSFRIFEHHFIGARPKSTSGDIYELMEAYIVKLQAEERISSAQTYQTSLNSLRSFKKRLRYDDIDVSFFKNYERFAKANGAGETTIGIYLRSFRTIVNQAIDAGLIKREDYPFRKGGYIIPAGRNVKKAITLEQIEFIFNFPSIEGSTENKALDMWIFSYLCNGLNLKDICRLKYSNIERDYINVIRAKTMHKSRTKQKEIRIPLHPRAKEIIGKWGDQDMRGENYVFPFLSIDSTPLDERRIVHNVVGFVNFYMKRIGNQLGIEIPLTSYVARHSFSTILMRKNAPISFISKSLGHSSIKTTENYLGSFEDDLLEEYSALLTNFDKVKVVAEPTKEIDVSVD